MNILIWSAAEGKGPFQRQLPDGRIFSDLVNVKPVFSFAFTNLRYVEQADQFTVDGSPMTAAQQAEVLATILAVEPTLDWYKAMKKNEIMEEYHRAVTVIAGFVDHFEVASWPKQEQQARAYIADNQAGTPLLDGMLVGRNMGESRLVLAQKIVANADAYEAAYSRVLGKYQSKMKAIDAATTDAAVNAIAWRG